MGGGQGGEILTAVIVHHNLLPVSFLQHFLPFFGCCQVCQTGLSLLQSLTVESIAAVHVDSSFDMAHIVGNERPAVQQQEVPAVLAPLLQPLGQGVPGDGAGLLHHQGPLEGRAFVTR